MEFRTLLMGSPTPDPQPVRVDEPNCSDDTPMSVVLRVGGFAFTMFGKDHDPPHVHVRYAGKRCRIVLSTLDVTRSNMSTSEKARAVRLVGANRETLHEAWLRVTQKQEGM